MKKTKILGIMTLTVLVLSGCQNPSDREAALEDQVAQLEQQVTSLEQKNDSFTDDDLSGAVSLESEAESNTDSNNTSAFSNDNLDTLTSAVNDIVKEIDKLVSGGSSNQQDFFSLQDKINEAENRLDYYEEQIEYNFRQESLTHDEARKAEYELEKLEDKLDNAEEKLEYAFGYDD